MKEKLNIEYIGGFSMVSKYLTLEHDANFAIILDSLVSIYNYKIDNLVKTGNYYAVKISNGYISRNTGLSEGIIKRNLDKIKSIGLVTSIKTGQSNTNHYIIHIDHINKYIFALETKFTEWFEKSLKNSKKEKQRSEEADKIKTQQSLKNFSQALNQIKSKSNTRSVQNDLTESIKIEQPIHSKQTVDKNKKNNNKTTTLEQQSLSPATEAIHEFFKDSDENGAFYFIEEYQDKIYKNEYIDFIAKHSSEELFDISESVAQKNSDDEDLLIELFDSNILREDLQKKLNYSQNQKMIYCHIKIIELRMLIIYKREYAIQKEYENTKVPASKKISIKNWKKLEKSYSKLPEKQGQGKFYTSKQDKENFFKLSEYRQDFVIKSVKPFQSGHGTASRPAIYIEEAKGDNLRKKLKQMKTR